jgi:hypothetical protein
LIDRTGGTHFGTSDVYSAGELRYNNAAAKFTSGEQVRDYMRGVTIQLDWADLEQSKPNQWDFTNLSTAITTAETAGQHEFGLRIFAGWHMPAWIVTGDLALAHWYNDTTAVANLHWGTGVASGDTNWVNGAGGSFASQSGATDYAPGGAANGTIGARSGAMPVWWDQRMADHYERLMSRVAREVESDDRIRHVQIGMPTTVFAEPMIHQTYAHAGDGTTRPNLLRATAAGWTQEAELELWRRVFQIHHACFTRTRTVLCINVAERFVDVGDVAYTNALDPEYSGELQRLAKSIIGDALILQNNSLLSPRRTGSNCWLHTSTPRYTELYTRMTDGSVPRLGFQTDNRGTILGQSGDSSTVRAAVQDGIDMGGAYVELPVGYHQDFSLAQFQAMDAACTANANARVAP